MVVVLPVPAGPMIAPASRGFSNAYAAASSWSAARGVSAVSFGFAAPCREPCLSGAGRVSAGLGPVERVDHELFGVEDVLGGVLVEFRVVEHGAPVVQGDGRVPGRPVGQAVAGRREFDASAGRLVRDRVACREPLRGVEADGAQQALGFGADVGRLPCGVRLADGFRGAFGVHVEPCVCPAADLLAVGELGDQQARGVLLARGVHGDRLVVARVHVAQHRVDLDAGRDPAELVVPVAAFLVE
ncbi:hypothetical protein SBP17_03780 [Bifidobacterium thermophilum]|nr:hypothetical protein [Bifidobacterium thermophilum]